MDYEIELERHWSLSFDDMGFLNRIPPSHRLLAALELINIRNTGRFIGRHKNLPAEAVIYVADQLGAEAGEREMPPLRNRNAERYRVKALQYLGWKRMTATDRHDFALYIAEEIAPTGLPTPKMVARAFEWTKRTPSSGPK
ncbi:DUF4158 domain-containing protein [Pelagibius sp. Alg239-R121]|uniref:DUF4158 domain-containing protein n=1 Tax=Pelagibius sp. Alg239-R121 TaxID=2993448 RepID=UPI0024A783CC|nr:DUF4158 domain-containing protein [Pelagibius sp. Alg239-R121]